MAACMALLAFNTTPARAVEAQGRRSERVPETLLLHGDRLVAARARVRANEAALRPAMTALRAEANAALAAGPWAVTEKTLMPPSGDARDYQSFGPYWWPDSTKPNGLPFVRRDGVVNPVMRRESDAPRLYAMTDAVETLSLAFWFTGDEQYAERATVLLRRFFLDSLTGMRPHLRYGQAIPGVTQGRGIGIIDTRDLPLIADAIVLLRGSGAWTAADDAAMLQWNRAFLEWLLTSPEGVDERKAENNHGTWYDAQVVGLALFVGDTARAAQVLREWTPPRLAQQLAVDGSQPEELARTRPLHYSVFNLDAMTRLAEMGRHVGVDLWAWRGANGAQLRTATTFLAPYLDPAVKFPKDDVSPVQPIDLVRVVRRVSIALSDSALGAALRKSPAALREADRSRLYVVVSPTVRRTTGASAARAAAAPAATRSATRSVTRSATRSVTASAPESVPVSSSPTVARSMTALDTLIGNTLRFAAGQLARTADTRDPANGWPRHTRADGSWEVRPATQWISGFFPGSLWYMYDLTRDAVWRARAERWTVGLEPMSLVTNTHDLGFVLFDSFGNGNRLTDNAAYREVLLRGAATLAKRFNPTVGAIKSWDVDNVTDGRRGWVYPVIVDNLMNLELLYWASKHGGDSALATVATRHALTSLAGHVRDDGSTAHVVLFDTATGARIRRVTWQGFADTSAWARGQAWAIHGLTAAFRESKRPELLEGARRVADWWLAHLPVDGVPFWDFRHPGIPDTDRDASAAAIAASGLYELSSLVTGAERERYRRSADATLTTLCAQYLAGNTAESILLHSVGNAPQGGEIDVGIAYADYYLLESIVRRRALIRE